MNITLQNRVALVTGAGRGIGRAIATKLAAAGATVFLTDIDKTAITETQELIRAAGGVGAFLEGDVTKPDFAECLVTTALQTLGSIDIVVNNAGYTWDSVIQKTTDEQYQAMLEIHAVAPFRILRAASTWIREQAKQEAAQGRRITRKVVNITSISGIDGNPGQIGYSSGKAAVIGLTKTLAKEWGRYSVTVNAVGFGLIETRLVAPLESAEATVIIGDRKIRVGMQEKARSEVLKSIPLARMGTPDEAANAVLFFCSPLSDYVTGEVLVCSGGLHF